jgi:hypothetical protein
VFQGQPTAAHRRTSQRLSVLQAFNKSTLTHGATVTRVPTHLNCLDMHKTRDHVSVPIMLQCSFHMKYQTLWDQAWLSRTWCLQCRQRCDRLALTEDNEQ